VTRLLFSRWRRTSALREPEEPIRAELFSIERLEQHGESLALAQRITASPGRGRPLAVRLRDNSRVLLGAYRAIAAAIREERAITPAAQWLVDNYHVVEEQIREIRADLPDGFYRQLPKLAEGPLVGHPRVFGLAWAFVAHTDSLFDPVALGRFVRAYQRVQPLTIGELWAVAITLRIVLVENLRRAAEGIVSRRTAREEADALADCLLDGATADAFLRSGAKPPMPVAFAAQLVQRLRDHDPVVTPGLHWLDERLAAQGTTADELIREEHRRQGATNVTVRNVITSMRLMSAIDWSEFFESVSLVDKALRAESRFAAMDFPTRDRYRHAIEELARGSRCTELEVVARVFLAARAASTATPDGAGEPRRDDAQSQRRADPGFHLIAGGRPAFEKALGFRVPLHCWLPRLCRAAGISGYLATIAILTALFLAVALVGVAAAGASTPGLSLFALLALIPASDLAVALVNRRVTKQLGPQALAGLELCSGVPAELRTVVAVPTMLTSLLSIEQQIERLEVHHLASPDDDLCFALLSDWTDAATEHAPGDDELLGACAAGIARLNRRHGPAPGGERFLLLHRRRVWNEGEGKWIGWERKRGKLHELDRWLRGATDTTFLARGGHPTAPTGVRYVITLDADTRLPLGAARRLVGKMAHPLNRPSIDRSSGRVVEGHAVLQPRITPSLPAAGEGSLFLRVFAGPCGIDPYAAAVSDVYQDLLGEGSYTGKGIYDVDAFEKALAGRVPESSVLSHDLLEGIFARAGLVSDVDLVEDFPTRYDVAAARQHRWARGDWQLLPWILGRGRDQTGDRQRAAIPLVGRWKMLDNLRRTLVAPASFLVLLVGWCSGLAAAATASGFLLATMAIPILVPLVAGIVPHRRGIALHGHLRALGGDFASAMLQIFFATALLAHQAWLMTDAILLTLGRLFVRRRRMLEWLTAAQAKFSLPLDAGGFYRRMAGGVVLGALAAIVVACAGSASWPVAAPFVILWLTAPITAQWASRSSPIADSTAIEAPDAATLRMVARRTWRFFESFVGPDDHWLAPDNFQEEPAPVIAHRTSPTNIGLYLLSAVAARDFGWTGTVETMARLEATLDTVQRLEHCHGHLYNWYDTRDLRPLEPKYVSSVDSGNFAGHLIALGNACREMIGAPVVNPSWRAGFEDALALLRESRRALPDDRRTHTVTQAQLDDAIAVFAAASSAPASPAGTATQLAELAAHVDTATDIARTLAGEWGDAGSAEVLAWVEAMGACVHGHERDLEELLPWARLLADAANAGVTADPALAALLGSIPTLSEVPDRCDAAVRILAQRRARDDPLILALERSAHAARSLERRLAALETRARQCVDAMEFDFLFDRKRQLLSIGYQVAEDRLDPSCYDLLASEARLASFVAIAKGDVPAKHWFRLGRLLVPVPRGAVLVSWSGSLFEYLMPSLVMRQPEGSLLDQTCRLVVRRQVDYGAVLGVPWGFSESAYNVRDVEHTYQYSSFGVPGLGLKRGLSADTVVAPYATALAAMVDPHAAVANLARLLAAGGCGRYGYYEALDYTAIRLPPGAAVAVVRAYMAHHQGMTLVALGNALHGGAMRARFHAEPTVQATELLLQERVPRGIAVARPRVEEEEAAQHPGESLPPTLRRFHTAHDPIPRTHLLSNGRYAVLLTAAGSGYSRWRDLAVTRWREDVTCDPWGTFVFLRDVRSGEVWSAGYQPSGIEADSYEVSFSEGRAEIVRRDGSIQTTLEVAVSPESDAEVRRVSIQNLGNQIREIELTSYAEIVLAPPAADAAHPAFTKLFVQTEHLASLAALVATRRRRSPAEPEIWAAHLAVVEGETVGSQQFETDRARFLGRGRGIRAPISVMDGRSLSGTVGTVLDPVFSLRHRLRILPGATARVAFWTMVAPSRSEVLDLADKHRDATAFERAVTLAWTQAQIQLQHLGVGSDEAHAFQRLANRVLYADPSLRPVAEVLKRNEHGPSTLWTLGISGDLPIVLVRIDETEDLEIVRQLLRAHEYWRMKQLAVDLVILNERSTSYAQDLHEALETLVRVHQPRPRLVDEGARGRVWVLRACMIAFEARGLLQTVARAVLLGRRGSLSEQVRRRQEIAPAAPPPRWRSFESAPLREPRRAAPTRPQLEFWNGLGGFADGGREYVTTLGEGQWTPAPWTNVIANQGFGFQVSVEGGGYTWSVNSRENQVTAWANDATSDGPGEAIYLRDLDSGLVWCPTALPIRTDASPYVARHGQGYSRFEHGAHEIALDLLQYVPLADPIKISRLRLRNRSSRSRRLSVTAYVEWVLGTSRGASAPYVVTEIDASSRVMLASNPWRPEFGSRVAFADLGGRQTTWTGDRTEFLGRNGTLDRPRCLATDAPLSRRCGAGLDPCGALQTEIGLLPGEETEIVFLLGETATRAEALTLVARYRAIDLDAVLSAVTEHWDHALGAVQVKTPDRSMDLLLNRWLLYQTLACRLWARSAFYQAGGAYGFRDQLQDVMALAVSRPDLTREHLLRAAARQFGAGDVQHWWHPHSGRGVRTRVADDCVWLPYATAHYLEVTGDHAVLDAAVPFLEGPALRADEHESYFQHGLGDETGTLFEHCARALDRSLTKGSHGLPLIAGGDWNDGMNRVGIGGSGESVWLGWFLHATLSAFAPLAEGRGELSRAAAWRQHATALQASLEQHAWDGDWYRRGYFDDGTPLGSAANTECRIDSIAQSWSVISGTAEPARAQRAMASVYEHLVRPAEGLILLFAPPFDKTASDPGYIKGYPPGIRENGGQYTHAAIWSVIAFAMLGDGDKAAGLFAMLNPIRRASSGADLHRYRVEPYAVCADVYAVPPHVGRGGWTWYTGSSGWLYRAGLEWILGFRVRGAVLSIDPCVPPAWRGFEIEFRHRSARYHIVVENPAGKSRGIASVALDGVALAPPSATITLVDDGVLHRVRVVLG